MNELIKESFRLEGGSIKIEKTISLELAKVLTVLNNREKSLYTFDSDFFHSIDSILKNKLNGFVYHTNDCFELVERFKDNICSYLKIDDFFKAFYLSDFDLFNLFFDEIITLLDENDKTLIKNQILVPKKDLDDIFAEFNEDFPLDFNKTLKIKLGILKAMGLSINSIDILESVKTIVTIEKKEYNVFTYIFKDDSGLYKIGRSRKVEERLKSLQTGNPTISIVAAYKGDFENELHRLFSNQKVKGEWFCLTQRDLENIRKLIKNKE